MKENLKVIHYTFGKYVILTNIKQQLNKIFLLCIQYGFHLFYESKLMNLFKPMLNTNLPKKKESNNN